MTVKEQIEQLASDENGEGYANACEVWKGLGEMGKRPYGWWIKPFGENARWIGSSWYEVKKLW